MDRRVLIAVLLMLVVAIAPSLIWPPKPADRRVAEPADSVAAAPDVPPAAPAGGARDTVVTPPPTRPPAQAPADTVWVTSPLYRFGFSTRGAGLVVAELSQYRSFARGDTGRLVQLVPPGAALLTHALVAGGDTVRLDDWTFRASASAVAVQDAPGRLELTARREGAEIRLTYDFAPDRYVFGLTGQVTGLGPSGAQLLVGLGRGLRSVEADSADDFRNFALVTRNTRTESERFSSVDSGEVEVLDGPFGWAGVKSKYFFAAVLAIEANQPPFSGAVMRGVQEARRAAPRAEVLLTRPLPPDGAFRYQVYAGPMDQKRLARIGHGLDDANPYGWIFRPIVQPVSVFVVDILLWMHEQLNLEYGWVLIIFGVLVRLALWPLNQKAMESGIRMQAVAPLIKEIQERHKNEPERLQREMLRIYREHKVNPFGGCLPMLLPMPVLLALFFVFANTIEFRGVSFMWLPDLSRPDPYYVIPVLMGLSMFAVSKVGQIGIPPNPQSKMLLYVMPIFLTVLFLNFASGLNLYYAASNVFSLPQQYLIARRRLREAPVPRAPAPRRAGGSS